MSRATCRCGQALTLPADGSDRIVCPHCGAKVRVRRPASVPIAGEDDGFIRFPCACGRRLKVATADARPGAVTQCRCPDCNRTVDVPRQSVHTDPEASTAELSTADKAMLDDWAKKFDSLPGRVPSTTDLPTPTHWRSEAGMRVCPQCGKPIHLGAEECKACGVSVPRR